MPADLTLLLDDVSVHVGSRALLQPTSLSLACGGIIAIIGRNGAGKSTLINAVSGLRRPTRGRILFGGVDIATLPADELARQRAYLPQIAHPAFGYRVREIVELGRFPHAGQPTCCNDAAAIRHALHAYELTDLAERTITTLSGGERQRVRMARLETQLHERLHHQQPAWLLLDEPNAALDIDQQHRLMARLRAHANRGCGVLLILHDLALAALYADSVLLIEDGKVVEHGPAATILEPDIVRRHFGIHVSAVQLAESRHSLYPHPREAA